MLYVYIQNMNEILTTMWIVLEIANGAVLLNLTNNDPKLHCSSELAYRRRLPHETELLSLRQ